MFFVMHYTRVEISHSWAEWATYTREGAFSVRGMTDFALLYAIKALVENTIPAGIDARRFCSSLQEIYKQHDSEITEWRATRIYRTFFFKFNLDKKRLQMIESASIAPYWRFMSVPDAHTNTMERFFHGKVFLYDSPVWKLLYPPVSPYSRSRVDSLSERGFVRGGFAVSFGEVVCKKVTIRSGTQDIFGIFCDGKTKWFDPKFVGLSNEELLS